MNGVRRHGSVHEAATPAGTGVAAALGMVAVSLVLLTGCGNGEAALPPAPAAEAGSAAPTTSPATSPEATTGATPTPTPAPGPTTRPHGTTTPHGGAAPGPGAGAAAPAPAMIWPVRDAAAARQLQADVDGGSQPWLLDPQEVALSYTSSVYGWTSPETTPAGPGTVQVRDGQGGRATVHLVQPVRAGSGGIWVVSAAERT
ncbi:MAG: hypothetical protein OJJ54_23650 [Pseudonocardia sp.]|nr:hypothetical protein [Pseudonocardia sp.]